MAKIVSMDAQKHKKDNTKGINKLFFIRPNQLPKNKNRPTFTSAQIFDDKKKILTMYNSPSKEI